MPRLKNRTSAPGRAHLPIDWDEVDKRLVAGCDGVSIAGELGIHPDTLYNRCQSEKGILFTDYSAQKRKKGNHLLHMAQFNKAMKGSDTMLIFLGKVRLDQIEADKRKELHLKEEQTQAFDNVMRQLQDFQARNIEANKINNE